MFQVVDNLLPAGYVDAIEADVTRTGFNWYYINDVTSPYYGNNSGFVHPAFDIGKEPTDWYPFIKPLVYSIEEVYGKKIDELYRIRVGLLTPTNKQDEYNTPHVDFLWPHKTACFYATESDGDTVIFKQRLDEVGSDINNETLAKYVNDTKFEVLQRVSPAKNRLVIFDGFNYHASTKPKLNERRVVITVNFI